MDMIKVSAKTLDEAITKALIELGTTSDNLDYTIVDKGSSGLLGFIGAKPVVISVRKKRDMDTLEDFLAEDRQKELQAKNKEAAQKESVKKEPARKEPVKKEFVRKESAKKEPERREPFKSETVKRELKPEGNAAPSSKPEKMKERPVKETDADHVEVPSRRPINAIAYEDSSKKFLLQMFEAMNMEVEIKVSYCERDRELSVDLIGDDMGILIGKRGQTLDSLQYLVSLVVNKDCEGYVRVKLDTENYRARRKDTLEILAKNIAYKVKRTRRAVSLEPMNPYERRIIHAALQDDKYVLTRSEGEEPFRHVVVLLKRDGRDRYN